jgi:hypothetical protein
LLYELSAKDASSLLMGLEFFRFRGFRFFQCDELVFEFLRLRGKRGGVFVVRARLVERRLQVAGKVHRPASPAVRALRQPGVGRLLRERVAVPDVWLVDAVEHKVRERNGIHRVARRVFLALDGPLCASLMTTRRKIGQRFPPDPRVMPTMGEIPCREGEAPSEPIYHGSDGASPSLALSTGRRSRSPLSLRTDMRLLNLTHDTRCGKYPPS